MTNPFKTIAAWILGKELTALKARLTSASTTLDALADKAVGTAVTASEDVKKDAEEVLAIVLTAVDKDRSKFGTFEHAFVTKLYTDYQGSLVDVELVATKAKKLEQETVSLFEKIKL
jgi:hypothetical protein